MAHRMREEELEPLGPVAIQKYDGAQNLHELRQHVRKRAGHLTCSVVAHKDVLLCR